MKKPNNGKGIRRRLSYDESDLITQYRRIKKESESAGVNFEDVKHGWLKSENSSLFFKNPDYKDEAQNTFESLKDLLIQDLQEYTPPTTKIKRSKVKDGHLLVVDLADLHINKFCEVFMTGDYYNSQRAVERAIEGVKGIVQKSSGFNIEKIVFVVGNDVLNTDNIHKATTKGTAQDTDLHWYKAFKVGLDCYVSCVDYLLGFADVEVIHCPSNHDYITGTLLAETLAVYYRNHKNVTFQTGPKYRKYYQYHLNLIEFEHGDKGKPSTLPLAMANEVPQLWANTKFRYCCLHHVHHQDVIKFQSSKDYIGVNVTYMRSPSPADIWHFESDYVSLAAIEGQIYSKENGRVSHITHYF